MFSKFYKAMITAVKLSHPFLRAEVLRMESTESPQILWTSSELPSSLSCNPWTVSQTKWTQSLLSSLSKMPSQPRMMKSKLLYILKAVMSGSAITTLGLPSYFSILASMSPKVLLTESLPGNTLYGPYITYC